MKNNTRCVTQALVISGQIEAGTASQHAAGVSAAVRVELGAPAVPRVVDAQLRDTRVLRGESWRGNFIYMYCGAWGLSAWYLCTWYLCTW